MDCVRPRETWAYRHSEPVPAGVFPPTFLIAATRWWGRRRPGSTGTPTTASLMPAALRGKRPVSWLPCDGRAAEEPSLLVVLSRREIGRLPTRPVLKHGPRSLTCVQVNGRTKPRGEMKVKGGRSSDLRGRSLCPAVRLACRSLHSFHSKAGIMLKEARGVSLLPRGQFLVLVVELWCLLGSDGDTGPINGSVPVRRGAQARDLPYDAVSRICCWSRRLCLGSRLGALVVFCAPFLSVLSGASLGGAWAPLFSPSDPALSGVA